jgi:hypothetical protein
LVPLYLPATISPGPFQEPATDEKKTSSAEAALAALGVIENANGTTAANPHTTEKKREYMILSLAKMPRFDGANVLREWLMFGLFRVRN